MKKDIKLLKSVEINNSGENLYFIAFHENFIRKSRIHVYLKTLYKNKIVLRNNSFEFISSLQALNLIFKYNFIRELF